MLARLDFLVLLEEVSQVGCYLELVWIGIGLVALAKLLDLAGSDLEVLLGTCQLTRSKRWV